MREEGMFVEQYNRIYRSVDERCDIRGSALSDLVKICLENNGEISSVRRERFRAFVPDEYMDHIESTTQSVIRSSPEPIESSAIER